MKVKLQKYFGITEKGMNNTLRAARFSFLKFFTFMFPPMLVFLFLQDMLNNEIRPLTIYMGILAIIFIVMCIVLGKEYRLQYNATYEESAALRIEIANKFKNLPLSYFSTHNISDLSQAVMMDVNNVEMTMSHALPQAFGFFAFFLVMTIMFIAFNPLLGFCLVIPIWVGFAMLFLTRKSQTKLVTKYYKRLLDNSKAFQEAFEMQQEIKSYSLQKEVEKDVAKKIDDTEKIHIKSEFKMATIATLIGILPYLSPVLVAIVGAMQYKNGNIDILYYVGYLMAATTISAQFAAITQFLLMIFFFGDSFKRIRELRAEPVQKGIDKEINKFDIKLENVHFGYGDNKVINGVNFVAKQGEITALIGPSGCGKTTILRLISRLYDYDSGKIEIDGEDIKNISTKSLFDKTSIVFQDVVLFNTSVLENIRIGRKDATDEEVIEAAKLANVDEIVSRFPKGYHTIIGENGSKLSGGERHRISIARAFLKNAPIILLDEISAALDVENEMKIQNSINKLIENKTVIIISHRLKSIEKVDKIILMNEGAVDSIGTHSELLENSELYRNMVNKSKLTEDYVY